MIPFRTAERLKWHWWSDLLQVTWMESATAIVLSQSFLKALSFSISLDTYKLYCQYTWPKWTESIGAQRGQAVCKRLLQKLTG